MFNEIQQNIRDEEKARGWYVTSERTYVFDTHFYQFSNVIKMDAKTGRAIEVQATIKNYSQGRFVAVLEDILEVMEN